jgi:prefoldin subunit 5
VDTPTLQDLAQVSAGIVAYAIINKTLNFVKKEKEKKDPYCLYCTESLREIKQKIDLIIGKLQKLGGFRDR